MNRVLQFFGSSLVLTGKAPWVRLKINRDLAMAGDVAGLLIVFELFPVHLIEARGIRAVDGDGHIVQFRAAASFELNRLAGLHLEERSSLFGLRNGETVGALLNLDSDFFRDLLECILHP